MDPFAEENMAVWQQVIDDVELQRLIELTLLQDLAEEDNDTPVLNDLQVQDSHPVVQVHHVNAVLPNVTYRNKRKIMSTSKLNELVPEECAICLETPTFKKSVCTPCDHYFCKPCLNKWLKVHKTCPKCRGDVSFKTWFQAEKPVPKKVKTEENDHWSIFHIAREMLSKHFQ